MWGFGAAWARPHLEAMSSKTRVSPSHKRTALTYELDEYAEEAALLNALQLERVYLNGH